MEPCSNRVLHEVAIVTLVCICGGWPPPDSAREHTQIRCLGVDEKSDQSSPWRWSWGLAGLAAPSPRLAQVPMICSWTLVDRMLEARRRAVTLRLQLMRCG